MIRPGEIYMADFAEAGPHPVIVLSREELNRGRYALVVICTSARFAAIRGQATFQLYRPSFLNNALNRWTGNPCLTRTGGLR